MPSSKFAVALFLVIGWLAMPGFAAGAGITVTPDIVYGAGVVNSTAEPTSRPLMMDAYLPVARQGHATPAIILAFGGAFHRGDKGDFQFEEDGARDSSMAAYCRDLAARGIACFSIDYRVTPEDPVLPDHLPYDHAMPRDVLEDQGRVSRIELVRARMGLPPLDDVSRAQLYNATFAGISDAAKALDFVRDHANRYHIDPQNIAVGGFSAGATIMMNLAYGLHADVSGVVSLSGAYWGYELAQTIGPDEAPALMFVGQHDLPGIVQSGQAIAGLLATQGNNVESAWVPGFGHFYPKEAPSLAEGYSRMAVIDRIVKFLKARP